MPITRMSDLTLKGKRVLIREDLNVPLKNGKITSDIRIRAALPTIKLALEAGAQVMIMSHLGRPEEGTYDEHFSLAPIAERLSVLLEQEVPLIKNWINGFSMGNHPVVLLENVRFLKGEKENSEDLAKKMARLCDVFVMDAFATAHREEVSTSGVIKYAPATCAGPLLTDELDALTRIMDNPKKPVVAIVGGSKVSSKLSLLEALAKKVDCLIVGGGIANTFIAANGYTIGKSLYEPDLLDEAERLTVAAKERNAEIPIPTDVIVSENLSDNSESSVRMVSQIDNDEKVFDIGPDTTKTFINIIKKLKRFYGMAQLVHSKSNNFQKARARLPKLSLKAPAIQSQAAVTHWLRSKPMVLLIKSITSLPAGALFYLSSKVKNYQLLLH